MSSTDLNRIRRYPVLVPFALNIVSGVVKNGTLTVSWNSGVEAAEQIDYGIGDDSVPNTTDWTRLKPGERGFIEGENKRKFLINHEIPFPETFVDTYHYFRVRSESRRKETLESEVYRVYVSEKVIRRSYVASVQVKVESIHVPIEAPPTKTVMETSPDGHKKPTASSGEKIATHTKDEDKNVSSQNQPEKTLFETNPQTTIS